MYHHCGLGVQLLPLEGVPPTDSHPECKGVFPHKLLNHIFFQDPDILNKSFNLTKDDFYKRDHENLLTTDLNNFNIKENLIKYANNDTDITLELYRSLNKLSFDIFQM